MAALTQQQLREVQNKFGRDMSREREAIGGVTKNDVKAAATALDALLVAQTSTINAAIPEPARSALTSSQKARLLSHVVLARFTGGA